MLPDCPCALVPIKAITENMLRSHRIGDRGNRCIRVHHYRPIRQLVNINVMVIPDNYCIYIVAFHFSNPSAFQILS